MSASKVHSPVSVAIEIVQFSCSMNPIAMECVQESEEEKTVEDSPLCTPIGFESLDDSLPLDDLSKGGFDYKSVREDGASIKCKITRELFSDKGKKVLKNDDVDPEQLPSSIIPFQSSHSSPSLPLLTISQISDSLIRFAFEEKVLNVYGTFRSSKNFKKYLRADRADREGFSTITLVIKEGFIPKFLDKIEVNACMRIEGVNVVPKNNNDGGSTAFSLHVDATTFIIKAESFDVSLLFVPEIKICQYLFKASRDPSLKATIAFVVVQIDKVVKSGGVGTYEQLTIADGPNPMDLATLSFVNQRKSTYHDIVAQYQKGNIVMFVARNIGVFKEKFNTLSVLDITLLTPVLGERRKAELEAAFRTQLSLMGYGKEVFGTLEVTNFNSSFIAKKCALCKVSKVSKLEGGYCIVCGKAVEVLEVPSLEARIVVADGTSIEVTLGGDGVDKVLQLEDTLVNLYNKNVILTRVLLSEICKVGNFLIDNQGCVIGFNASPPPP